MTIPLHHQLPLNQELPPSGIGYRFADTGLQEKEAMIMAFGFLREAKRAGLNLRQWAQFRADELTNWLEWMRVREAGPSQKISQKVRLTLGADRASVEEDVVRVLSTYMRTLTDLKHRVSLLNPPLHSTDVKPFQEALESDQRVTVAALDPLRKSLQAWREQFPDETLLSLDPR